MVIFIRSTFKDTKRFGATTVFASEFNDLSVSRAAGASYSPSGTSLDSVKFSAAKARNKRYSTSDISSATSLRKLTIISVPGERLSASHLGLRNTTSKAIFFSGTIDEWFPWFRMLAEQSIKDNLVVSRSTEPRSRWDFPTVQSSEFAMSNCAASKNNA